jgi:hypothetical protein
VDRTYDSGPRPIILCELGEVTLNVRVRKFCAGYLPEGRRNDFSWSQFRFALPKKRLIYFLFLFIFRSHFFKQLNHEFIRNA